MPVYDFTCPEHGIFTGITSYQDSLAGLSCPALRRTQQGSARVATNQHGLKRVAQRLGTGRSKLIGTAGDETQASAQLRLCHVQAETPAHLATLDAGPVLATVSILGSEPAKGCRF